MQGQAGFFDVDERLKELSAKGDHLERLTAIVDFELFRPDLARAVPRSDGTKGGRPPFDHVFTGGQGAPLSTWGHLKVCALSRVLRDGRRTSRLSSSR